jgi:hypothetical protein
MFDPIVPAMLLSAVQAA